MPPSLSGCWRKLSRAKEHRDALDQYRREVFAVEGNRPRLGIQFKPETSEYIFYVNHVPDLTDQFDRFGLMISDVVHNLRSTLDYLAYQLALLHTKGAIANEEAVQFPIVDDPKDWPSNVGRRLKEVDAAHVTMIEDFQPYNRFHENVAVGLYFHPLAYLRHISNPDKHRFPAVVMIPGSGVELNVGGFLFILAGLQQVLSFTAPNSDRPIELGAQLARVKAPHGLLGNVDVNVAGYVAPTIAFSDGRSVIAVLDKIAASLVLVLRKFEPLF